ncbi:ribonuclease HII [Robertmurraya sp. Marseille-Q9965]
MSTYTIKEIEERLKSVQLAEDPFLAEVKMDSRKGAQQLLNKWHNLYNQQQQAEEKYFSMSSYERALRKQGYRYIGGIDEVGRGPLAGPVVAACVILPEDFKLLGLDDSKKLSEAKRDEFYEYIKEQAVSIGIGIIEAEEIDDVNIYEATKKAMLSAIEQLSINPDFLLIDAMPLQTPFPTESIIKGDGKSISIAAASVIAKVTRDRMMKEIDREYPYYHFSKNMGYGTKDHLLGLEEHGISPYHRKSFEPIKSMLK